MYLSRFLEKAIKEIIKEYDRATKSFTSFNSTHEGYAVILEELDELDDTELELLEAKVTSSSTEGVSQSTESQTVAKIICLGIAELEESV